MIKICTWSIILNHWLEKFQKCHLYNPNYSNPLCINTPHPVPPPNKTLDPPMVLLFKKVELNRALHMYRSKRRPSQCRYFSCSFFFLIKTWGFAESSGWWVCLSTNLRRMTSTLELLTQATQLSVWTFVNPITKRAHKQLKFVIKYITNEYNYKALNVCNCFNWQQSNQTIFTSFVYPSFHGLIRKSNLA